jgi:hypothetical protein
MPRLSLPSPSMSVALTALAVALGGTSYAATQIGSGDVRDNSLTGADIRNNSVAATDITNNSLSTSDVKDGALRAKDFKAGQLPAGAKGATGATGANGSTGASGVNGTKGDKGDSGPAGTGRWVLIDAAGAIEAQSGGFSVASAYGSNAAPAGAAGNVYINANEPLTNNAVVTSIALQNQVDQSTPADGIMNGRQTGSDSNPEFSGEITATRCAITGVVGCAPTGTNTVSHFVVSPRLSDGGLTDATNRKRFYVIITGDSSDYVAPAA